MRAATFGEVRGSSHEGTRLAEALFVIAKKLLLTAPSHTRCATALKAVAEYAALATPARWEETVRGLLAAPHLPLVEVYSAARKT